MSVMITMTAPINLSSLPDNELVKALDKLSSARLKTILFNSSDFAAQVEVSLFEVYKEIERRIEHNSWFPKVRQANKRNQKQEQETNNGNS